MQLKIHEVGMRDGLQMEKQVVPREIKLQWIQSLAQSGVKLIQAGSFVHPKRVPQMADSDTLFNQLKTEDFPGVTFSGLVLNEKGLERGLACGADLLCMGVSASETHSLKNTRMSISDALRRTLAMAKVGLQEGVQIQVSVQSAFGCGYEGEVPHKRVLRIVESYLDMGLKSISLADTAGHGDPSHVRQLFSEIQRIDDSVECACHFHDNYGMGLANCCAALDAGVTSFEASFAGLGGCPFTAVAGGNVCTEDLVHMFQRMGMCTELKLEPLVEVASEASRFFGRDLPGDVYKSGPIGNLHQMGPSR